MKKLLVLVLVYGGIALPLMAQSQDYLKFKVEVPMESLVLHAQQVPPALAKTVNIDFRDSRPLTWERLPNSLESYKWTTFPSAPDKKADHYQVIVKANNGSNIIADYSADGTVLQSRSMYNDAPLPQHVVAALENSRYKGWNIAGDKEIIKYDNNANNIKEHYKIRVEKNNEMRNISFNYTEPTTK